ncbi:GNAT family N-acetyltransferase [Massilia sp. PWRC2]|uniref:GNAT family N-acetyltransferase n=1 Tax=Massilia sp. PWRC2 TaxID=2804626 RepID=UPI003CFB13EC
MKIGLTTRAAVAADADAVCTVLRLAILETCVDDHRHEPAILDAWLGNKHPAQVAAWMAVPANYMVVAEMALADQPHVAGGDIGSVGIVGVALINQAGKLALCHVLPQAQRHGVGTALLRAAEAKAREWGVGTVRIDGTRNSQQFYARFGYNDAGRDKTSYGLECNLLWKELNASPGTSPGTSPGHNSGSKRFCSCNPHPSL